METIKRKYNVSDLSMIEHNKTMLQHFTDEQLNFTSFDADFALPFDTDWQALITTAENQATDETTQDQLQQLTNDVDAAMEAARDKFQTSKFFIEKAFNSKPAVMNEFGFDDYDRQRKSQTGMIQFMHTFFATATKYAVEMAAAGYNAAAVAEIETLGIALDAANNAQEKFKGTRQAITEQRITAMNDAWNKMLIVSKAGKTIFRNAPAKYQWFLLPASSETGTDISIRGTVANQLDGTVLEGAQVLVVELGINTTTDSNGNYVLGGLPDGTYTLDFSAPGFMPTSQPGVEVTEGSTTEVNVQLMPDAP